MKLLAGSAPALPKTLSATAAGSTAARTAARTASFSVGPPPVFMAT
jgi:hypothetical protein